MNGRVDGKRKTYLFYSSALTFDAMGKKKQWSWFLDTSSAWLGYKMKFSSFFLDARYSNNAHNFSLTKHLLCSYHRLRKGKIELKCLIVCFISCSIIGDVGKWNERRRDARNFHDKRWGSLKFSQLFVCLINCSAAKTFHIAQNYTHLDFFWQPQENFAHLMGRWDKKNYENSESLKSTITPEHSTVNIP